MKVTFVYPRFEKFLESLPELNRELVDHFLGNFTMPPSLGIPILAALTPPDWDIELIDDNKGDPFDFDAQTDLVAINCFTPQATRALELADGYRAAGKTVIMGGFWPSCLPADALEHADAVCIGDGEPVWRQILEDAARGELKPRYHGGNRFDLAQTPIPRRDIFYAKQGYDWEEDLVQVARGCTYTCAMCAIPTHAGHRIRLRPIESIVEEIKGLQHKSLYLADDILFFPNRRLEAWSRELFDALTDLDCKLFVASTMALNTSDEFLDRIARAGVKSFYCTMNVDPRSIRALGGDPEARRELIELVAKLDDRGIRFFASFGLGRDWDAPELADSILDLCRQARIRTAEFFLFTPYPGSVHWDRLERQGRILHRDWRRYNGAHVVHRPLNMQPDELREMFVKVWRDFFTDLAGAEVVENLEPDQSDPHMLQRRRRVASVDSGTGAAGSRRAVVTGIGVISPIGDDLASFTDSVVNGRSGIDRIEAFDTAPFRTDYGGEVRGFDPSAHLSGDELELFPDRHLRLGLAAARQALADTGLRWSRSEPAPPRTAMVLGTCNGGLQSAQTQYAMLAGRIPRLFDRKVNLLIRYHALGKALSYGLGFGGPVWIVTTACSSSTAALGLAQELITSDTADVVLAGGADSLCLATMAGFDALKATSTGRTAPFSLPIGLNLGEGAAFWVVEEAGSAAQRGVEPLGEILGYAFTADAHHPTAPDPRGDGAVRTMTTALERAGVAVDELGCFNLHGTGTEANDRTESRAVARVIGEGHPVPVHSFKSQVGHCMGAAGILEASAGLVAMRQGVIPATINFSEPRPGCALDYVPNEPRRSEYSRFISCNYAFGGHNAGVVIGIAEKERPPAASPDPAARTVLTGGGAVTALGLGADRLLAALRRGQRGIVPAGDRVRGETRSACGGYVPEFADRDVDRRLDTHQMNPISRYATVAARLALADAEIRIGPRDGLLTGIINGVYVGPSEEGHMTAVTASNGAEADIAGFSSIVANATAGWVSNALVLKGYSCTVSQGADAGLFALLFAHMALRSGFGPRLLAGAADEVYSRYFINYDEIDFLHPGEDEERYRIVPDVGDRRVLGEGAAYVVAEELAQARARGARPLAEVVGFGQTTDWERFYEPSTDPLGLTRAIDEALARAGWRPEDVGLVLWSPQGNSGDLKTIEAVRSALAGRRVPLVTSVFHTGLCEATSGVATLAAVLAAWADRGGLWPQVTGLEEIDGAVLPIGPVPTLALATSELGLNLALAIAPFEEEAEP